MDALTPQLAVKQYVAERQATSAVRAATAANYRSVLDRFAATIGEGRSVSSLCEEDIVEWLGTLRHCAASTRCNHYSALAGFCGWLRRTGRVAADPMQDVRPPRRPRHVPRCMPEEHVAQLLDRCPDTRARAIVEVMVGMGLRCKEVCGLQIADWDRSGQVMLVTHGKGGHEREVPVPSSTAAAIDSYLLDHPATSGPLFRSYRDYGCGLDANYLSELVSRWMRAARVKHTSRDGRSAHALRHTAASDVLEQCNDLRVVQQMLGHQHLSTTSIYLRRADLSKMRTAMEGRSYRSAS
jgi:integrase/recombinase XerC